ALLVEVLAGCGDDKLIPGIVWQNLHPLLEDKAATFISVLKKRDTTPNLGLVAARSAERILASKKAKGDVLVDLFALVRSGKNADANAARQVLAMLTTKIQNGEITGAQRSALKEKLDLALKQEMGNEKGALRTDAGLLAAVFKLQAGLTIARQLFGKG